VVLKIQLSNDRHNDVLAAKVILQQIQNCYEPDANRTNVTEALKPLPLP